LTLIFSKKIAGICWNFKYLASLSDEFYDIEEQAFGNDIITPCEEW